VETLVEVALPVERIVEQVVLLLCLDLLRQRNRDKGCPIGFCTIRFGVMRMMIMHPVTDYGARGDHSNSAGNGVLPKSFASNTITTHGHANNQPASHYFVVGIFCELVNGNVKIASDHEQIHCVSISIFHT
jgi:hypothetical protein